MKWTWALFFMLPMAMAHDNPPALRLPTLDGQHIVTLASFHQRPVLLNFWSSSCVPCVRELPLLQAQSQTSAMAYVGVAIDEPAPAAAFARRAGVRYLQLAAPPADGAALLRRFDNRLGALPYTVVLNRAHQPCAMRLGAIDAAWLEKAEQACSGHG